MANLILQVRDRLRIVLQDERVGSDDSQGVKILGQKPEECGRYYMRAGLCELNVIDLYEMATTGQLTRYP